MSNENMSELFSKFENMVKEGNIPDEMKNILSSFSSNDSEKSSNSDNSKYDNSDNSNVNIDFETIMKMKSMMEKLNNKDDPRANLLLSLKPYLKNSRKEKVDQYIKLFNMSKVLEAFGNSGNEVHK